MHNFGPAIPTRINVVGTSGSGKSTFGKRLAAVLSVPYIELDAIFWLPNWQQPSDELFFAKLEAALAGDAWVLDGNYTRTIPLKWQRTEMIVWLDYSFGRTLFQAVKRAFLRATTKEELWPGTGNRESFRQSFFSRDSIILWAITSHKRVRAKYERIMADAAYSHLQFVRLRSPAEAEAFLKQVARNEASNNAGEE